LKKLGVLFFILVQRVRAKALSSPPFFIEPQLEKVGVLFLLVQHVLRHGGSVRSLFFIETLF
jgi:hypothetical protein